MGNVRFRAVNLGARMSALGPKGDIPARGGVEIPGGSEWREGIVPNTVGAIKKPRGRTPGARLTQRG